jgi:TonB family protein
MTRSMKALGVFTIAALVLVSVATVAGSDIKVIANSSVTTDSISMAELRRIYLLQTRKLKDGSVVEPVLQKRGSLHDAFSRQFLDRDSEEIRTYYHGVVFTGKGSMPREVNSDEEMVSYVARTRGAIGYVSGAANTDSVKVLPVAPESSRGERILLKRVEPEYPKELQHRGIEGTVRLSLTVSARGSVQSVQVIGGNPILAEAAEKAVREWVYSPTATSSTIEVSIAFAVRP